MFYIGMALLMVTSINGADNRTKIETQKQIMYDGVMALSKYRARFKPSKVRRLIDEVFYIRSKKGNGWIEPEILLGLAYNETDLIENSVSGRGSVLDCGICQNHVPLFSKTYRGRMKLCNKLKKSSLLSFEYAMKELNMIKRLFCRQKKPVRKFNESNSSYNNRVYKYEKSFYSCLLNNYNQGPRWLKDKWKHCRFKNKAKRNYCLYRNKYWIRSICFSKALWLGRAPKTSCRKATSLKWVEVEYGD